MDKQNLFKRLRDAMGVSHIKDMTPEEINDVFQSLHDKNEALRAENEQLKQRCEQAERERDEYKNKYLFAEMVTDCAERHLRDEHFEYYCEEVEQLRAQLERGEA